MEVPKEWVEQMLTIWFRQMDVTADPADDQERRMTRVAEWFAERCREKMLAPSTMDEYMNWPRMKRPTNCWDELNLQQKLDVFLAHRRSLPLEEPKKTPEERVTIEEVFVGGGQHENRLYRDGVEMKQADVLAYARRGLIEELKEESCRKQ